MELKLKNNLNKKNEIIYILIFLLIIVFTNNYFDINNINPSATSSNYYLDIAKSWPNEAKFKNEISSFIHAERFIIPYCLGFISEKISLNIFFLFQVTTYLCLIFFVIINYNILSFLLNNNSKIIFFSLAIFNPYIFRYFLANPLMLNDLAFFISLSLLTLSLLKKKDYYFYIAIIIAVISRQSSYVIFVALLLSFILPFKEKFIDYKKIIFSFLILIIKLLVTNFYVTNAGLTEFYDIAITGLFIFIKNNFDLNELLKFISYPLFSFLPLFIIILFSFFNKNLKIKFDEKSFLLLILIFGFFAQPILAGPIIAGKNIIRLSSYGYFIMIYLLCYNLKQINFNKKIYNFIIVLILILWSFHPTFSNVEIFKGLKFN